MDGTKPFFFIQPDLKAKKNHFFFYFLRLHPCEKIFPFALENFHEITRAKKKNSQEQLEEIKIHGFEEGIF